MLCACYSNQSCIFMWLFIGSLRGVIPAGDTLFLLQGSCKPQFFDWKKYGLSLSAPNGIILPSETCEVAITALAGGEFEFPKGSELVSAIYAITISKPLLKPLTIEIQHCVALETPEQCNSLQFVRATFNNGGLPYLFEVLPGGCFSQGNRYGSISCTQFCLIGISLEENEDGQGKNGGQNRGPDNTSEEEDSSSQDNEDPSNSENSETDDELIMGRYGEEQEGGRQGEGGKGDRREHDESKGEGRRRRRPSKSKGRDQHQLESQGVEEEKVTITQNLLSNCEGSSNA